tara:strand:+ start:792 stop:1310 length:519 start_codon:yes stop_codon:yes gene_type:complete
VSGAKSKNKGKIYERDVANFLSELYKEPFTRVPYSGAFIGGQNIKRIDSLSENQTRGFKGDIIPPDTFPLLVIEAKNYGEFQWHNLALGKEVKQLDEWIKQAQDSCEDKDKWILSVKISRQGEFVLWDPTLWSDLDTDNMYKQFFYTEASKFWQLNSDKVKQQSKQLLDQPS